MKMALLIALSTSTVMAAVGFGLVGRTIFLGPPREPHWTQNLWIRAVILLTMIVGSAAAMDLDAAEHPVLISYWILCAVPAFAVTIGTFLRRGTGQASRS